MFSAGMVLCLCGLALMPGCINTDKASAPVGPDLRGKWSGFYYRTDRESRLALTAEIWQEGDAVTIKTDKGEGTACHFTGTISPNGHLDMVDAFDGQEWTSSLGNATTNHIFLDDYTRTPEPGDPEPPLFVLELTR